MMLRLLLPQFWTDFSNVMRTLITIQEYRLLLFLVICQLSKVLLDSLLDCFLTQDHMGLEISKHYKFLLQFWFDFSQTSMLHDKYPGNEGTLAITLLFNLSNIKHFMRLCNFNMGINEKSQDVKHHENHRAKRDETLGLMVLWSCTR